MDKQGADFRSALNSIEDRLNMKGNFKQSQITDASSI